VGELLTRLRAVVAEAGDVIAELEPDDLLSPRRIQSFDVVVVAAIFHAVSHFEGHAQEVIYIARQRRGEAYRFLWTPSDAQQSAP
jgi:microcystin degradation protein MlrC